MIQSEYKWFPLVSGIFVSTLIISNIIAVKLVDVWGLSLPAAVILFPITYIVGDILTEVYGYARARQVIWIGFLCNLLAVIAIWVAGMLAPVPFWQVGVFTTPEQSQQAYNAILGFTPQLLIASFIAYLVGEFLNSFVLAKLKIKTQGKFLWIRTIGSTIIGQGADSLFFISIAAFLGVFPVSLIIVSVLSQWLFKVAYETAATPLTYLVVRALKKSEGVDVYDTGTNFNPLLLKEIKK